MERMADNEATSPLMTSQEKGVPVETLDTESEEKQDIQDGQEEEAPAPDPTYSEPPDGGWGWCVVFANFICTMVMATQGPCFGIFYGKRLRELGASPTLAAWLFNFQSAVWNLAGPWAGLLSEKFTYRPVAMTSAFVASSSLILSATVTNPYLLLLTFSMFSGIGGGICINCCYHMSAKYFKRRLGLANGIMVTGGSIGLMVMPHLASKLQELYPFEWATLIAGVVMMNSVAATALFHPVEWHAKKLSPIGEETIYTDIAETDKNSSQSPLDSGIDSYVSPMKDSRSSSIQRYAATKNSRSRGFPRCTSVPHHHLSQDIQRSQLLTGSELCRKRRASESLYMTNWNSRDEGSRGLDYTEINKVSVFQYGSSTIMGSVLTIQQSQHGDEEEMAPNDKPQGIWQKFLSHYKPSVLRDPLVICLALCTCITMTSTLNVLSTIPFALNDAGYSLQSAASAMSVAAIADLVTRVVCAASSDRSWVKPRLLYMAAQLIAMVSPIALVSGWNNWSVVLACMSCIGVGLGILYVLDVYIIIRVLGVQKLQSVFGMSQLFRAFAFCALGPIGGVLRDHTESYASAIIFYTCNIFLGLLIMISSLLYSSYQTTSKKETQDRHCDGLEDKIGM